MHHIHQSKARSASAGPQLHHVLQPVQPLQIPSASNLLNLQHVCHTFQSLRPELSLSERSCRQFLASLPHESTAPTGQQIFAIRSYLESHGSSFSSPMATAFSPGQVHGAQAGTFSPGQVHGAQTATATLPSFTTPINSEVHANTSAAFLTPPSGTYTAASFTSQHTPAQPPPHTAPTTSSSNTLQNLTPASTSFSNATQNPTPALLGSRIPDNLLDSIKVRVEKRTSVARRGVAKTHSEKNTRLAHELIPLADYLSTIDGNMHAIVLVADALHHVVTTRLYSATRGSLRQKTTKDVVKGAKRDLKGSLKKTEAKAGMYQSQRLARNSANYRHRLTVKRLKIKAAAAATNQPAITSASPLTKSNKRRSHVTLAQKHLIRKSRRYISVTKYRDYIDNVIAPYAHADGHAASYHTVARILKTDDAALLLRQKEDIQSDLANGGVAHAVWDESPQGVFKIMNCEITTILSEQIDKCGADGHHVVQDRVRHNTLPCTQVLKHAHHYTCNINLKQHTCCSSMALAVLLLYALINIHAYVMCIRKGKTKHGAVYKIMR